METEIIIENSPSSYLLSDTVNKIIKKIALDVNFKDFKISVKEQDFTGDNFIGEIVRVKIISINENEEKSINLILKKAPLSSTTREMISIITYYESEIFVYTNIVPVFDRLQEEYNIRVQEKLSFAKFYTGIMEEFKEMVIMRDLADDGYVLHDKLIPFDYEHAAKVIQSLSRLHAMSFVLKDKEPKLFTRLTEKIAHTTNYSESIVNITEQLRDKILLKINCLTNRMKLESFGQNLMEKLDNLLDSSLTEPYNVICHGDCWNNNMMFKYEGAKVIDVVFFDWQIVRLASPATDLAYMIFVSMERDLIESHLQILLNLYYETLDKTITKMGCDTEKCYPKRVFMNHFQKLMTFGLTMSLCIIPIILSEVGKALPTSETVQDLKNGEIKIQVNDRASKRMNDLVDYFVKHEAI